MRFAGVVVVYNPNQKVKENIKSYIDYIDKLYVVDNTEKKDNGELFNFNKKIEYISNNKNLGIATALNIAANRAISDKFDWFLTMDQDSFFEKNSLKRMIDFILNYEKNDLISYLFGIKYEKIGIFAPFYKLNENMNSMLGFDFPLMVMTSGNLINLKIYKKIGGFKDWLFIDCVDFDYCLNLKSNGYEILQNNSCILNHNLGMTKTYRFLFKSHTSSNHSPIRKYFLVRNRHYIYDMYHNIYPQYCNLELSRTKKEAAKIILFEKHKIKKIFYMIKGYIDYKKGRKNNIYENKEN